MTADLVLCARTVPQCSFRERVELAANAGFRYVSMLGPEGIALRDSSADGRAHLFDHGVGIAELDALVGWLPGADQPEWLAGLPSEADFYAMADALGPRSLNVVDLCEGPPPPLDLAAEAFAAVCDRAARHELLVSLEFVPWSRIPDLHTALRIVELAGRANGGVMLDTWHLFRSGGTLEDVEATSIDRIVGLQVNDAPESERGARARQEHQRRLLPGEGVIGVADLLHVLREQGCTAPIGLEVTSIDLESLPAANVVDRVAAAIRSVLDSACHATSFEKGSDHGRGT